MHKYRRAKRASGVSIGLVSHISHTMLNKCIYIYTSRLHIRLMSHTRHRITFYCFVKIHIWRTKTEKKGKCSKKWIVPWGNSSHILSDICTMRLKCQCLPLDNCVCNSAWLSSAFLLLCIPLISIILVIVACILYSACERIGKCYCLTAIASCTHYIPLESHYNIIEREFDKEENRTKG
jgi:hypothetical protein